VRKISGEGFLAAEGFIPLQANLFLQAYMRNYRTETPIKNQKQNI